MLRLCHKYRKLAPIIGLLVEVLKIIEDEIFEAHMAELMPQWEQEYSCFQEKYYPIDYYTFNEIIDFSITIDELGVNLLEQLNNAIADSGAYKSRYNDFRYNWRCKLDPFGGLLPPDNYISSTKAIGLTI